MTLEKRNQRFTVTFTTNIRSIQGHKNNRFWRLRFLKILSQSLNLFNEEVNVFKGSSWVGDDHTEEVDLVSLRLIAHHGRSILHHSGFDHRGNLWECNILLALGNVFHIFSKRNFCIYLDVHLIIKVTSMDKFNIKKKKKDWKYLKNFHCRIVIFV